MGTLQIQDIESTLKSCAYRISVLKTQRPRMPSKMKEKKAKPKKTDFESRIRILEDREEIEELKARYCYHIDNHEWSRLAETFAKDGVIDCGQFGKATGRDAIQKFFSESIASYFSFFVHMVHNPLIEIHDNEAHGTWYWTEPATYQADGLARLIQGKYDEEYVKENGKWKFKSVVLNLKINVPFDFGWKRENKNKFN